jgi:hypothetical protein
MSGRSHLWLRMAAVALLAATALWPRAKTGKATAELRSATTHSVRAVHAETRAETSAAKLVSPPRTTKMVLAEVDESQLTN